MSASKSDFEMGTPLTVAAALGLTLVSLDPELHDTPINPIASALIAAATRDFTP
jgi:hypothetical protein